MKSYAEIKRTADKYTWELYIYSPTGLAQDNQKHKFLNTVRKVEILQTNAIKFEGGSWLYFSKASSVTISEYLYNKDDIIVTIKDRDYPVLGYHLRALS